MKRVTTEYFCDICGEPIERNKVRTLTLPRRVKYYTRTKDKTPLGVWDTVQYKNQYAAFEEIASFDKYVFGIPETIDPTENAVYVFGWQESSQFPKTEFEITRWGRYSVAVPKRK